MHFESIDPGRLPQRPQFGLRALLAAMAAIALVFALMKALGGVWGAAAGWFAILIAAHIAANAWGSKRMGQRHRSRRPSHVARQPPVPVSAPVLPLSGKGSVGRVMTFVTVACALTGGIVGSYLLLAANWNTLGLGGMLVGWFSTSVIGGFLGFLTSSFVTISARAIGQAASDSQGPQATKASQ
jgi:hypothetical protein